MEATEAPYCGVAVEPMDTSDIPPPPPSAAQLLEEKVIFFHHRLWEPFKCQFAGKKMETTSVEKVRRKEKIRSGRYTERRDASRYFKFGVLRFCSMSELLFQNMFARSFEITEIWPRVNFDTTNVFISEPWSICPMPFSSFWKICLCLGSRLETSRWFFLRCVSGREPFKNRAILVKNSWDCQVSPFFTQVTVPHTMGESTFWTTVLVRYLLSAVLLLVVA